MFSWVIFKYKDGSNPYIVKTEKEKNRILKKYTGKIEQIKTNVFFINNI